MIQSLILCFLDLTCIQQLYLKFMRNLDDVIITPTLSKSNLHDIYSDRLYMMFFVSYLPAYVSKFSVNVAKEVQLNSTLCAFNFTGLIAYCMNSRVSRACFNFAVLSIQSPS